MTDFDYIYNITWWLISKPAAKTVECSLTLECLGPKVASECVIRTFILPTNVWCQSQAISFPATDTQQEKKTKLGNATPKILVQRFVVLGRGFSVGGGGGEGVYNHNKNHMFSKKGRQRGLHKRWEFVVCCPGILFCPGFETSFISPSVTLGALSQVAVQTQTLCWWRLRWWWLCWRRLTGHDADRLWHHLRVRVGIVLFHYLEGPKTRAAKLSAWGGPSWSWGWA